MNSLWSKTNRNNTIKPDKDKTYDILIIDRNNDLADYDTSASMVSHSQSMNSSQNKIGSLIDSRRRRKQGGRYKPFTLRDYAKNAEDNMYAKSGGLGPNIGSKQWQEEKAKRDRIRDFSLRLNSIKKENLVFNSDL